MTPHSAHATAVERALAILEALDGSRRGLNISEISRKLGIPKSSAHVVILTLDRLGYLRREPDGRNYFLGLKAYGLGQGMARTLSLAEFALPHMQALVERLRLTAHLAVLDNDQGVYIQKVEAPGLIKFGTYVGRRMDLHCTGVGKVLLTWEPAETAQSWLARRVHPRYTKNTLTSARGLSREIEKVRRLGYAVDDEEEELEVRCVAVPVFDRHGRFLAALSVTGTVGQIPLDAIDRVAGALRQTASSLAPGA